MLLTKIRELLRANFKTLALVLIILLNTTSAFYAGYVVSDDRHTHAMAQCAINPGITCPYVVNYATQLEIENKRINRLNSGLRDEVRSCMDQQRN